MLFSVFRILIVFYCIIRVSNTPGNPGNLLEMYKVSWKLPGSVRPFVINVPDSYCICKQDQYDLSD